jgi:hypothetical protein
MGGAIVRVQSHLAPKGDQHNQLHTPGSTNPMLEKQKYKRDLAALV